MINKRYYINLFQMGWTAEKLIKNELSGPFPFTTKECEELKKLEKLVKEN